MKIIMIEDIEKVGEAGEVIEVADGFARNYLLPKKFAIPATKTTLKKVESIKKEAEEKRLETMNHYKALAAKLEGKELTFLRKADENGHLYGSVSEKDIYETINEKGFDIDKKMIVLDKHLKEVGNYDIKLNLTKDVNTQISIKIEEEE